MSDTKTRRSSKAHAILSAASSRQWLNCPPSARLQEGIPGESSSYAEEGTAAHELAEYKIRRHYKNETLPRPQSKFFTEEIENATDIYAEFVGSVLTETRQNGVNPLLLVEERLDFSNVVPDGFGTGDAVIIGSTPDGSGLIHVVDFKAGRGVLVSADHNSQMMLYALGALNAYGWLYDVDVVRMSIVQPRMENISTFECTRAELLDWAEAVRPVAELAYRGEGEQKAGDWCRFCRAKPLCRARAEEALSLAREEFSDLDTGEAGNTPAFKPPALIAFSELEDMLPTLSRIGEWIEAVFAYVSDAAINHGKPVRGYKVVHGRSVREFSDTETAIEAARKAGYGDADLYKTELRSLTEIEKLMGKKKFAEVLGAYVSKPPGKLTLVPESDKRSAVNVKNSAESDFDALD